MFIEKNIRENEMEEKKIDGGEITARSGFVSWLDNFWYHYKWHTIAALFVLITGVVITLQMCTRTSYDIHIVYAGNHEIRRTGTGASPYSEAVASLNRLSGDYDGDGEVNVDFINLFVVNEEERDALIGSAPGLKINETLVKEDTDTLENNMIVGDYYIFFLSRRLYLEYSAELDGALLASLEPYTKEGADYEFVSEDKTGIYLRSLNISRLPTLSELPEDTVICMRKLSPVASVFGKKQNEKNFKNSEEVMKNILAFD